MLQAGKKAEEVMVLGRLKVLQGYLIPVSSRVCFVNEVGERVEQQKIDIRAGGPASECAGHATPPEPPSRRRPVRHQSPPPMSHPRGEQMA